MCIPTLRLRRICMRPVFKKSASNVLGGLFLDAGERMTFRLRFDGGDGLAINEERVVGLAGFEGQFAKRDTLCRVEIHLRFVLNGPAAEAEDSVDLLAGFFFVCHIGCTQDRSATPPRNAAQSYFPARTLAMQTLTYALAAIGTTLAGSAVDAPQFMRFAIAAL